MTAERSTRGPRQLRAPAPKRISLLDLDLDQIEAIEELVGANVKQWDDHPSQARVYRSVYMIAYDVSRELAGKMTLRELQDAVDLDGDEDPDQSEPAPRSA